MRILDKYIYKELLSTFFAVLTVLLLITFGTEVTKLLAFAMEGKIPSSIVFQLLLLKIPATLEVILPLVALLSVMLAIGRLYQDQEMVVLQSCAVPHVYFQKRVALFLIPMFLLTAWVSIWLTPWSFEQTRFLTKSAKEGSPLAGLSPGKFNELPNGGGVLYAKEITENGEMTQIWFESKQAGQDTLLMAPHGRFDWVNERLALVLLNGKSYEGFSQGEVFSVREFARFEGFLPEVQVALEGQHRFGIASADLLADLNPTNLSLLEWRMALPFSVLVMGLLGLKMSKTKPREGRFAKIFYALMLYVIYSQTLVYLREMVKAEQIHPLIGLWPVPAVFLLYALYQGQPFFAKRNLARQAQA